MKPSQSLDGQRQTARDRGAASLLWRSRPGAPQRHWARDRPLMKDRQTQLRTEGGKNQQEGALRTSSPPARSVCLLLGVEGIGRPPEGEGKPTGERKTRRGSSWRGGSMSEDASTSRGGASKSVKSSGSKPPLMKTERILQDGTQVPLKGRWRVLGTLVDLRSVLQGVESLIGLWWMRGSLIGLWRMLGSLIGLWRMLGSLIGLWRVLGSLIGLWRVLGSLIGLWRVLGSLIDLWRMLGSLIGL